LEIAGGYTTLAAGDELVGVIESQSGAMTIATNTAFYEPTTSWVFFSGNWNNNEFFGFPNTYYLRANFGPSCTTPTTAAFSENVSGLTAAFTDASTNTNSWMWDFGDGNTSTMQNPTHTYATTGTYTVCLTASSNCGADSTCQSVTYVGCGNPSADFTFTSSAGTVDFTNTSSTTGGTAYAWDVGDGNSATTIDASNTYTTNGSYTVTLLATDSCGVV